MTRTKDKRQAWYIRLSPEKNQTKTHFFELWEKKLECTQTTIRVCENKSTLSFNPSSLALQPAGQPAVGAAWLVVGELPGQYYVPVSDMLCVSDLVWVWESS